MELTDPLWDDLTDADWAAFATAWNAELCGQNAPKPLPKLPWLFDDPPGSASEYVVPMNFTASADAQWKFVVVAFKCGNEETHGHLAAGPVEHLLGNHGSEYITVVEQLAGADPLFAKMLRGCNQNQMLDEVWRRLCLARGEVG